MRFLGIDFGWQGKPSGLAALEWNGRFLSLRGMERRTSLEEILQWVDTETEGGPAMIAVDAPTVIVNATGMRTADKLMHHHFGKYHAGAYPANLGRPHAARTVELGQALQARGFTHAAEISPRVNGRYQIEVHPHAASVRLFQLDRIVKYKKGRLAERRVELARFRNLLLTRLPALQPRLNLRSLPPIPETGAAMKDLEDQMDAVLCAYIGAYWWYWGAARNLVVGTCDEGYIVVPGLG